MSDLEIYIRSVGTALPGQPIDNAMLARKFGMPRVWEEWVETYVGTKTRHLARDLATGQVRQTVADLSHTAGARALSAAGLGPDDIDLMVLATSSPDMLMPATVNLVADRLGIDGVPTYQLQSGCCGAIQAFDVAQKMLLCGLYQNALVLGGDSCAKHLDTEIDVSTLSPAEQINGVLFGDGAGAAVLTTEPIPQAAAIQQISVRLVGRNREPGQVVEWFGQAELATGRPRVIEDYKAIEESVPKLAAEVLSEILDSLHWQESDVDYLLPPQLSAKMTEKISQQLMLPSATEITCVSETGNTGNAIPFFQLDRALPRMASGDRAVGLAVESSKWIKSAFALQMS